MHLNILLAINKDTVDYATVVAAVAAVIIIPITIWGIKISSNSKIERQKLELSVKPRLWLNGAGYKGLSGELTIDLNNKGEAAYIDDFRLLSGAIILHSKSVPWDLEKGSQRNIYASSTGTQHIKDCEYGIEILYHNALNQPQHAIIKGIGNNVKIIIDEPLNSGKSGYIRKIIEILTKINPFTHQFI